VLCSACYSLFCRMCCSLYYCCCCSFCCCMRCSLSFGVFALAVSSCLCCSLFAVAVCLLLQFDCCCCLVAFAICLLWQSVCCLGWIAAAVRLLSVIFGIISRYVERSFRMAACTNHVKSNIKQKWPQATLICMANVPRSWNLFASKSLLHFPTGAT